jgi:uncharacterized ferritin-like protein (DUF455 family)
LQLAVVELLGAELHNLLVHPVLHLSMRAVGLALDALFEQRFAQASQAAFSLFTVGGSWWMVPASTTRLANQINSPVQGLGGLVDEHTVS